MEYPKIFTDNEGTTKFDFADVPVSDQRKFNEIVSGSLDSVVVLDALLKHRESQLASVSTDNKPEVQEEKRKEIHDAIEPLLHQLNAVADEQMLVLTQAEKILQNPLLNLAKKSTTRGNVALTEDEKVMLDVIKGLPLEDVEGFFDLLDIKKPTVGLAIYSELKSRNIRKDEKALFSYLVQKVLSAHPLDASALRYNREFKLTTLLEQVRYLAALRPNDKTARLETAREIDRLQNILNPRPPVKFDLKSGRKEPIPNVKAPSLASAHATVEA